MTSPNRMRMVRNGYLRTALISCGVLCGKLFTCKGLENLEIFERDESKNFYSKKV